MMTSGAHLHAGLTLVTPAKIVGLIYLSLEEAEA